jgi:hypothetical protein
VRDFRDKVKEDLIKNKVSVIDYSSEEHVCDLELTVEMSEKKIAELQAKISAIHAIASALPKLDWDSHDQFCLWDEFNEAVQTIQELSK